MIMKDLSHPSVKRDRTMMTLDEVPGHEEDDEPACSRS